jgi:hypothetical protein
MNILGTITHIRNFLTNTFDEIDTWFELPETLRHFRPARGSWTIDEVLEHIGLTNHFLLILIDKGTSKAWNNVHQLDLAAVLADYTFRTDQLTEVGLHQSFEWIRPEHMEPKGEKSLPEVRQQLKDQLTQCLAYLDRMPNGEGVLYKTTMTVNQLGKIDVYEYIYFLAQHGSRHIMQMQQNEKEWENRP